MNTPKKSKLKKLDDGGRHGTNFQIDLLALFLHQGYVMKRPFLLTTDNPDAGKFDDLVFQYVSEDGREEAILLQAKHRLNKKKNETVTIEDLLSIKKNNDDFSLPKYFLSYLEIKSRFNINKLILATNIDLCENAQTIFDKELVSNVDPDVCLNFPNKQNYYYICNSKEQCDFANSLIEIMNTKDITKYDKNIDLKIEVHNFFKLLKIAANIPKQIRNILTEKIQKGDAMIADLVCSEIYFRIEKWYVAPHAKYLSLVEASSMFLSYFSKKYRLYLESFSIRFNQKNILETFLTNTVQMFHIKCDVTLMDTLNVYQNLKNIESTQGKPLLCAKLNDNHSDVFKAFRDSYYQMLMLVCDKSITTADVSILEEIIDEMSYKKIFVIAKNFSQNINVETIELAVNITEDMTNIFLENALVCFQGINLKLTQILPNTTIPKWRQIITSKVMEHWIQKKTVKVGEPLIRVISEYYISRNLIDTSTFKETSEENIFSCVEKCIIISDTPGMGKTTLLNNLAYSIKVSYPHYWIMLVHLNKPHITKYLRDLKMCSLLNINIEDFLIELLKLKTQLEKAILNEKLNGKEEIILLFDGFDEICPRYEKEVKHLLKTFLKEGAVRKIFLTTRPHMSKQLREEFNVPNYGLKCFDTKTQETFLVKYWQLHFGENENNKLEIYAKYLLEFITECITETERSFIGIPLQLKMLADVYKDNKKLGSLQEYIDSDEDQPLFREKINMTNLYSLFIKYKCEIYMREKCQSQGNVNTEDDLLDKVADCLEFYQKLAVSKLFNEQYEHFNVEGDGLKKTVDVALRIGITEKSDEDLTFIHRTFAEYFAAEYYLSKIDKCKEALYFFLNHILASNSCETIKSFINSMLPLKLKEINVNCINIDENLKPFSDILHKCNYNNFLEITKFLISNSEYCCKVNRGEIVLDDSEIIGSPLNITAFFCSDVEVMEYLVQHGANINASYNGGTTVLHDVVYWGYEVTKWVIDNGYHPLNRLDDLGRTELFYAVTGDCAKTIEYLIEKGGNVNISDNDGKTPLYNAINGGYTESVKYLLSREGIVAVSAEDLKLFVEMTEDNIRYLREHSSESSDLEIEKYQIILKLLKSK